MSTCERRHCFDDATYEVQFGTPQQIRRLCEEHTDLYRREAAAPVLVAPIQATVIVHEADEANKLLADADRCDRCGARAYVACMTHAGQELLFCGHCYHQHKTGLAQVADIIHDCRVLLHA